jgi:aldose 1-epimerase
MKSSTEHFGFTADNRESLLFTFENDKGITLKITNYGGTIVSLLVPDKTGSKADIVLGLPSWDAWIENPAYFNCIIGRTANRIAGAKFELDGVEYKLSTNSDVFQLHGGIHGFHHKLWEATILEHADEIGLELEYVSVDGEEGFPGNLSVKAIYTLNNKNEISLVLTAITDKATPVNMTNHGYFNLSGEGSGDIYSHELMICADKITVTDSNSLPTGALAAVTGTPFDFTVPHQIGERIDQLYKGYDNNFVLRNQTGELALAAKVFDPSSKRVMEVFTTEPGVQLYTANWFDGTMMGKCGKPHVSHTAFCLETQHYPDSMNIPEFPNVILRPGEQYHTKTVWKFTNQ